MKDQADADLISSYRATLKAFSDLVTLANSLTLANREGRHASEVEVAHIEQQISYARAKIAEIDRFLALWPEGDGQVH
jgi:hypothetical protein